MGLDVAERRPFRAAVRRVRAGDALRVHHRPDLVVRVEHAVDAAAAWNRDTRVRQRAAPLVRERLRDARAAIRVAGAAERHGIDEWLGADGAAHIVELGIRVLGVQALALRRALRVCHVVLGSSVGQPHGRSALGDERWRRWGSYANAEAVQIACLGL